MLFVSLVTLLTPIVAALDNYRLRPKGGRELPVYDYKDWKGQCLHSEIFQQDVTKAYIGYLAFTKADWSSSPCEPPFFEALARSCQLVPNFDIISESWRQRVENGVKLQAHILQLERIVDHDGVCLMWISSGKNVFDENDPCIQRAVDCLRPPKITAARSCVRVSLPLTGFGDVSTCHSADLG